MNRVIEGGPRAGSRPTCWTGSGTSCGRRAGRGQIGPGLRRTGRADGRGRPGRLARPGRPGAAEIVSTAWTRRAAPPRPGRRSAHPRAGAARRRRHRREIPDRPPGASWSWRPGKRLHRCRSTSARRTPVKTMMPPRGPGSRAPPTAQSPEPPRSPSLRTSHPSSQPQPRQCASPAQAGPVQPSPSSRPGRPGPGRRRRPSPRPRSGGRPTCRTPGKTGRGPGGGQAGAAGRLDAASATAPCSRWWTGPLTLRFPRDGDLKGFSVSGHDAVLRSGVSARRPQRDG